MNLQRALTAPWVAIPRIPRWLHALIMLGAIGLAIAVTAFAGHAAQRTAMIILSVAVGLWWGFLLPNMMALDWSARDLALPGIRHDVSISLGLYIVLTLAVPTLLLVALGNPWATALVLLTLAAEAGFLYATLPAWLMLLPCFAMILGPHLPGAWLPPLPGHVGFVALGWKVAVAAGLVVLLRWPQLQRLTARQTLNLRRPMIVAFNHHLLAMLRHTTAAALPNNAMTMDDSSLLRWRPDRQQREANLAGTGPGLGVRSLRVALGGQYLPQTWRSHRRALTRAWWPLVLLAGIVLIDFFAMGKGVRTFIAHGGIINGLWFVATIVAMFCALTPLVYLERLWRQVHTQVPLMALLPGLAATPAQARGLLTRTITQRPLMIMAGCEIALVGTALYAHLPTASLVMLAVTPVIWAGTLIVGTLQILGGPSHITHFIGHWIMPPALLIATLIDLMSIVAIHGLPQGNDVFAAWLHGLQIGWLIIAIALALLGRDGWRRYRTRPHPFMNNRI